MSSSVILFDCACSGVLLKKPGGQIGHRGETLHSVANPAVVKALDIDRRTLPSGHTYEKVGEEARQVIGIEICRKVTEYRAEVLASDTGERYIAEFPLNVTRPV